MSRSIRVLAVVGLVIDVPERKIADQYIGRTLLLTRSLISPHLENINIGLNFDIHTEIDTGIGGIFVGIGMVLAVYGDKGLTCHLGQLGIRNGLQICMGSRRQHHGQREE